MRLTILILMVSAGFAGVSSAQVSVSVVALQPSGVALVEGTGQLLSQAIPAGQPWTAQATYTVSTNGTANPYFIDYVETEITPPLNQSTLSQSMVAIESRAFAQNNTTVSSLFTTAATASQPGTQRFRVTLTSAQPQNVELRAWAMGQNFGNATISATMSFGTVNQTWTWTPGAGYTTSNQTWPIQVNGTVDVDLVITGQVTPGPGGGLYYDGYDTRWSLTVVPINGGSVTYWGTGCGPSTLSHIGAPTTGSLFTMLNLPRFGGHADKRQGGQLITSGASGQYLSLDCETVEGVDQVEGRACPSRYAVAAGGGPPALSVTRRFSARPGYAARAAS